MPKPPSLRNIHQELYDDIDVDIPSHGSLERWASNGVLLLNTTLTVRAHQAASHQGKGWERFTDRVIEVVANKPSPVVFILWGASARKKRNMIDTFREICDFKISEEKEDRLVLKLTEQQLFIKLRQK